MQELSGSTPIANLLTGLGVDDIFTRTNAAGARHFLTDALGSTLVLTDPTGSVLTQYTYEPFGNASVSGSANANPYQYTGRENDATGLYYYRTRYYNPGFQRFVAEDTVGFEGGLNLYAYVGDDPIDFGDPFGLKPRRRPRSGRPRPPCPPPTKKPPEQQQPPPPVPQKPDRDKEYQDCLKQCLEQTLGANLSDLGDRLKMSAQAAAGGTVLICGAVVFSEPYLAPALPACANTVLPNVFLEYGTASVGFWNLENMFSTLGCAAFCAGNSSSGR